VFNEKSNSVQDSQMKLFPLEEPYDVVPAGFRSLAQEEGPARYIASLHKNKHANDLFFQIKTYWVVP
jgi:hypothetical protein